MAGGGRGRREGPGWRMGFPDVAQVQQPLWDSQPLRVPALAPSSHAPPQTSTVSPRSPDPWYCVLPVGTNVPAPEGWLRAPGSALWEQQVHCRPDLGLPRAMGGRVGQQCSVANLPSGYHLSVCLSVCHVALSVCYRTGPGADSGEEGESCLCGRVLTSRLGGCQAGGPGAASSWETLAPSGETEEEVENPETTDLPEKLKHQLRHRELFLSRQLESLPATHIRYPAARRVPGVHPAPLTPALLLQREMQRHPAQRDRVAQVLPGAGGEAGRPAPCQAAATPRGLSRGCGPLQATRSHRPWAEPEPRRPGHGRVPESVISASSVLPGVGAMGPPPGPTDTHGDLMRLWDGPH